mgnify:CR=1 FL=1
MRENRDHPMNKRLHLRLLMGFVLLGLCSGCNRPDAPWCLMSAGEWMEDTLIWEPSSDFALVVENHLDSDQLNLAIFQYLQEDLKLTREELGIGNPEEEY